MGNNQSTAFDIEALNALSARLFDLANSIANVAAHEMGIDIRVAARTCDKHAGLLGKIAAGNAASERHRSCPRPPRSPR